MKIEMNDEKEKPKNKQKKYKTWAIIIIVPIVINQIDLSEAKKENMIKNYWKCLKKMLTFEYVEKKNCAPKY